MSHAQNRRLSRLAIAIGEKETEFIDHLGIDPGIGAAATHLEMSEGICRQGRHSFDDEDENLTPEIWTMMGCDRSSSNYSCMEF